MGSSLLPEEFTFVGFLPLQSYIDQKKEIKNGVKCPPERENVVRCLILRDHLESIGCTFEDLRRTHSEVISDTNGEEVKHNDPNIDEDFFKQIDLLSSSTTHKIGEKPLIIVDA